MDNLIILNLFINVINAKPFLSIVFIFLYIYVAYVPM